MQIIILFVSKCDRSPLFNRAVIVDRRLGHTAVTATAKKDYSTLFADGQSITFPAMSLTLETSSLARNALAHNGCNTLAIMKAIVFTPHETQNFSRDESDQCDCISVFRLLVYYFEHADFDSY